MFETLACVQKYYIIKQCTNKNLSQLNSFSNERLSSYKVSGGLVPLANVTSHRKLQLTYTVKRQGSENETLINRDINMRGSNNLDKGEEAAGLLHLSSVSFKD